MIPIICIVGPTGVGKTKLSIEIAKVFHGEIISADSMQFYRGLDIGTAKIKPFEMDGIKHHLIDILDPSESFSVSNYQQIVREKISELSQKNTIPILVGGSGLFLQAVIYQYDFDGKKRTDFTPIQYLDYSNQELYATLVNTNPELAKTIHPNNRRRLLRSLEIAEDVTQKTFDKGKDLYYPSMILIGLEMERQALYERINQRVDIMIRDGLVDEVRQFYNQKITGQSVMAIGYKELYAYFDGKISLEEAIETIKKQTRRYAKRQMTWFKNKMNATWYVVQPHLLDKTITQIIEDIKKRV